MSRVRWDQRVWFMDVFLGTHIMIFHEFEKSSWDLRNTRKHIPEPLEKHRSFASEGFIWLVERSNTGAEEICRLNPTHLIGRFGAFWTDVLIIYWAVHDLYIFLIWKPLRKQERIALEKFLGRQGPLEVTRRAVVSRVIRVQRRYTVQIRPIWSGDLGNFGWFFELFIELYGIYIFFPHRIHPEDSFG